MAALRSNPRFFSRRPAFSTVRAQCDHMADEELSGNANFSWSSCENTQNGSKFNMWLASNIKRTELILEQKDLASVGAVGLSSSGSLSACRSTGKNCPC